MVSVRMIKCAQLKNDEPNCNNLKKEEPKI